MGSNSPFLHPFLFIFINSPHKYCLNHHLQKIAHSSFSTKKVPNHHILKNSVNRKNKYTPNKRIFLFFLGVVSQPPAEGELGEQLPILAWSRKTSAIVVSKLQSLCIFAFFNVFFVFFHLTFFYVFLTFFALFTFFAFLHFLHIFKF